MKRMGYLRWIKKEEELKEQVKLMEEYQIDELFQEKVPGKYIERPELKKVLKAIGEGDQLIVDSLNSLGRDYGEIAKNVLYMREQKVTLTVLDADFLTFNTGNKTVDDSKFDLFLSLLEYLDYHKGSVIQGRPVEYSLDSELPEKRVKYQTIIELLKSGVSVVTAAQQAASTSIAVRDQVISAVGSSAQNLQTVAKEFVAMDAVLGNGFGIPGGKQP